jgi:hypothetical protein
MTVKKDFKRLVRTRMTKTGESYTAARAVLLESPRPPSRSGARPVSPRSRPNPKSPIDYDALAGMRSPLVAQRTGRDWAQWVSLLDRAGAGTWAHRDIASHLHQQYQIPEWWTQMVTVGYERIKGLRVKGQRRGGAFEAGRSRTFPVAVDRVFRAFRDGRLRSRWLADPKITIRTATPNRSMRITWHDGTSVHLWFTAKGAAKSQVAVQHVGLDSPAAVAASKAYWGAQLDALGRLLGGARPGDLPG